MSLHAETERVGERDPPDPADAAVRVDGLTKTYGSGDAAVTAVDDVSFAVEAGTAVGLLGPNGAGKTTAIKSLLGLVIPTHGTAEVAGIDVHADPRAAYRHVGAMLEGARNTYWRLTVRENLRFFAALAGRKPADVRERHDELLARFDLTGKADTPVKELSRGMQQKVSLAATLARDAEVVFLDEPTLGLDVESSRELRRELRRLVEESGMTVVVSSHDMDVIEAVCDRVVIMSDGAIVADERVADLLDLFRTRSYAVTVEGAVPERVRARLRERFDADGFDAVEAGERFTARVVGDGFYELTDTLRDAGLTVADFQTAEPDLEDVFLRVTGRDDA
ncbi:ABC transporter ATP-binding protein [Halosegnis marinus]|uniref:ABC transporter ATP-binding protein n=1 Tax=Halosegnis marinus TaxID=3034023 RepID=A0ABD5ZNZ0_9EURY|nr:ABC transporter ATP-binding protein [Halosegnis sp. DT85]